MRKRTLAAMLSTGLVAGLVVAVPMTVANAAGTTNVVVHPKDLNSGGVWTTTDQSTSKGVIADGPGTPAAGFGSYQVTTGAGTATAPTGGKDFLRNSADASKPLDSVTALSYDFYRSSSSTAPSTATSRTAINIGVNFDNNGTPSWTNLVYEPDYDTSLTLADDTWQSGDAFSATARWWSTRALPGVCGAAPDPTSCPDTFVPWAQIKSALDNLGGGTIDAGGIEFVTGQNSSGSPWSNYVGAVDNIHIADTTMDNTYDFEYGLGPCSVNENPGTKTFTLLSDCTTTATISVRDGWTVDGDGHTITATETPSTTFTGAVLQNAGTSMNIQNLHITTSGWNLGGNSGGKLFGISFANASGAISNVSVNGISHGDGVQEGNAIDINNFGGATLRTVTINSVKVTNYQKTGIRINGNVNVTLTNSTIGSAGTPTGGSMESLTAANSVQVSRAATATITGNHISGNDWDGPSTDDATAVLLYQAGRTSLQHNVIDGAGTDIGIGASDGAPFTATCNLVSRTNDVDGVEHSNTGIWLDGSASGTAVDNTITGFGTATDGIVNIVNQGSCVPTAPVVTASGISATTATISWPAGAAPAYAPVSGWAISGPDGIVNLPAGTTTYKMSDLQPGVRYTVSVRALNVSGPGPWATTKLTTLTHNTKTLTMTLTPRTVVLGQRTIATGYARTNGVGTAGATVTFWRLSGKTWVQFGGTKTAANGSYAKALLPPATWTIRATSAGFPAATAVVTVTSRVSIKAVGRTISVGVTPKLVGKRVVLQALSGRVWRSVTSTTLSKYSTAAFKVSKPGVYRVVALAVPGYAAGVSPAVRIK